MNVAIILLAAGSSSRLGQSKQLLKIDGMPLLERSAQIALKSGALEVVAVLGSNEKEHRRIIKNLPVKIIQNPNWNSGIGSSIKTGLNYLLHSLSILDAVIIMVCDQPLLEADHLRKLVKMFEERKSTIIASRYAHVLGVPALFSKHLFEKLLQLNDQAGAKSIIHTETKVETVDFPGGHIDIDTVDDYKNSVCFAKNNLTD